MNTINNIWINNAFFKDSTMSFIAKSVIGDLRKSYVIWETANNIIEETMDKEELSTKSEIEVELNQEKLNQGFLALKRVFNEISTVLKINLGIDEINYKDKKTKKDFLGTLERFGITRKKTLKNMLDIRNCIEHKSENAPNKEMCMLFSEYIWFYNVRVAAILDRVFARTVLHSNKNGVIDFRYEVNKVNVAKSGKKEAQYKYVPSLYIFGAVNKKYVYYVDRNKSMEINNIELLNTTDERIKKMGSHMNLDMLDFVLFKGEITDQDMIADYITQMIIPEMGGLEVEDYKEIFIKS